MRIDREDTGVHPGLGNALHQRRPARNRRPAGNVQMPRNHPGAADNTVLAEHRAARDTGTASHHRILADHTVMADMHQVIEFATVLDDRVVERSAVDRRVGTDFDVVANQHPTQLRNLDPVLTIRRKTETIGTDHCPSMNNASLTDLAIVINGHSWVEHRTVANSGPITNDTAGIDDDSLAQRYILADGDMRPNGHADRHFRFEHGTGMNAAKTCRIGI